MEAMNSRKAASGGRAILSVSFGTSHAQTRARTIDAIDAQLAAAFPERAFYAAWTSGRIVAKLRDAGEHHDTLDEALERLARDGIDDVVVASSCLMHGAETSKIEERARSWAAAGDRRVAVAEPLLARVADRNALAQALADEFAWMEDSDAALLMGHGSRAGSNEVYSHIQHALDRIAAGRFFVGTVEGQPAFDDVLEALEARKPACVHLAPLMIVAGDHATRDLAGDNDDSWQSRLQSAGLSTHAVLKGLGEYAAVRDLVCEHARAAASLLEEGGARG